MQSPRSELSLPAMTALKTECWMPPDTRRAQSRSMGVLSESSCGRARFGASRKLAEKSVDATVAERMDYQVSQRFWSETNDVCSRQCAFRELYRRPGQCGHDVAFLFTGFECTLDLGDSSSARLAVGFQLVERNAYRGGSRVGGDESLSGAEPESGANHYAFRRETRHRNEGVLDERNLHHHVIGDFRQLARLGVNVV